MTANTSRAQLSFATILLILIGLGQIAVTGLVVWALFFAVRPPLHYSSEVYNPADTTLCPGEALAFTTTVYVDKSPAMLEIAETWWSVDLSRTAVRDVAPETVIWTDPAPFVITAPALVTVPSLPNGDYEYRRGVKTSANVLATYAVPFTVPENCP